MTRCTLPVRTVPAAAFCALAAALPAQHARTARATVLRELSVPIRTIDPRDADYRDLEPLVDRIGSARFVVLGEATHSEGATAAIKARLAMFLHRRMGFGVLAWEAGVLDCAAMDTALRDPEVELRHAARQMMRNGWDALTQTWPLFEYARASWRTPHPLRMAGFDGERPPFGTAHFLALVDELAALLPGAAVSAAEREALAALSARAHGYLGGGPPATPPAERAMQRALVERLDGALASPVAQARLEPGRIALLRAALATTLVSEERKWRVAADAGPTLALRDGRMAEALRELAEGPFAAHKIAIWAATAHVTRNTSTLVPIDRDWSYEGVEHMGDEVARRYGDDLYTIAVTSHHGEIGRRGRGGSEDHVEAMELPPADSFEAIAHDAGLAVAFVDLRGAPSDSWLRGEFVARPLGLIPTRARWCDVVDAFVFLDEMTPEQAR